MNIKDIFFTDMDTTMVAGWLRRGLSWWTDELLALVPPSWRERLTRRPQLVVDWDENGLSRREGSASKPFDVSTHTSAELDNAAIVMPMRKVLTRELDLPLLPANDLRRLIALDIERLAPFPADAAYFDTEVVHRDQERGRQRVLLGVLPRATLAEAVTQARSHGLTPSSIGARDDIGSNTHFDFLGQAEGFGPRGGARVRLPYWWAAVVVLMVMNVGLLAWRDSADLDSLRDAVNSQSATVAAALRLRARVDSETERRNELLTQLAHNAPLRVLDAVTKALPENAWAERVEWNGTTVQVSGYHEGPANLLQSFEASKVLHNARVLSAATRRVGATASQPFEIAADLRARP